MKKKFGQTLNKGVFLFLFEISLQNVPFPRGLRENTLIFEFNLLTNISVLVLVCFFKIHTLLPLLDLILKNTFKFVSHYLLLNNHKKVTFRQCIMVLKKTILFFFVGPNDKMAIYLSNRFF